MVGVVLLITQGLGNTRRENGIINVRNLVSKLIREEIVILIITIIIIITRGSLGLNTVWVCTFLSLRVHY